MTRTRIKICGITNLEDARAAAECGADALGFILVPESPRFVPQDSRAALWDACGIPFVQRVAVVRRISDVPDLEWDFIQFYEECHDDSTWLARSPRCIRAIPMKDEASLLELLQYPHLDRVGALLLDTHCQDRLGGAGIPFNWELAREAKEKIDKPIILAGGLTPENVGDAIAAVRPWAVDVSSGVEAAPGRKDHAKLKAFIRAVREADSRL